MSAFQYFMMEVQGYDHDSATCNILATIVRVASGAVVS